MYYVNKRELEAFPFDLLYKTVLTATTEVKDSILESAEAEHKRNTTKRIAALYANREDSYEGNEEEDFPFVPPDEEYIAEQVALARKEAFSKFAEKYDLPGNANWLLPQFTAYVAKMPISRVDGKIDPKSLHKAFGCDDFHKGLYYYATHPVRGDILNKQYTIESRNYSALVPLLMMPFKKFDNVPYSSWNTDGLDKIIDSSLYNAMSVDFDPNSFSKEELLLARQEGLLVKTGKTAGSTRNPVTTHKLYGVKAPLGKLPWLAQVMLFQIWVAHPSNRTDLMVLDWNSWDTMPEPLIEAKVIADPIVKRKVTVTVDDWV